jgi:polyhydroxybutyrate depolymerase
MYLKKLIGFFIVMLLIITALLPVYSTKSIKDSNIKIEPALLPGNHIRFIFFDMSIRLYRIHIPPSYNDGNPIPLVIALHGMPQNSKFFMEYTELNEKADEEGFIVVYPNGGTDISYILERLKLSGNFEYYWNCWDGEDIDDLGFIRNLIESLKSDYNIDENRIYITGFSNGGYMTHRIGAELSDVIAAIAPVGGSIGGQWKFWSSTEDFPFYICPEPENPLSVIIFHGRDDPYVRYEGLINIRTNETVLCSVNESLSFWVEHNNCDPIPQVDISDSGNIITRTYANGSQNTEVVLYSIVDGIHEWFGSSSCLPCEISCNDLMWEFFESHPKQ